MVRELQGLAEIKLHRQGGGGASNTGETSQGLERVMGVQDESGIEMCEQSVCVCVCERWITPNPSI